MQSNQLYFCIIILQKSAMQKLNQSDTLVVDEFEEDKFHLPTHSHTYYEIIYIVKATEPII